MPQYPKEIEVQRVTNLVRGFGWEKIKEEVQGKKLVLTLEKEFLTDEELTETVVPD